MEEHNLRVDNTQENQEFCHIMKYANQKQTMYMTITLRHPVLQLMVKLAIMKIQPVFQKK